MSERLVMGNGAVAELPGILGKLGLESVLLVTDPGLVKAGVCGRVRDVVEKAGVSCSVFDQVEPDPRIEIVEECAQAALDSGCQGILGLGGGSSLDIAKLGAVMLTNGGSVRDYLGIDQIPAPGAPTILIPTTAGTGSEVTPIAVLTDSQEHLKKGVVSDRLYPSVALVDPELTMGLPPLVTAYTGIDALTHCIEAYTNRFALPFIDAFALEGIRLIGSNLRRAVKEGGDLEARYNMALGSLYGGLCLGSVNTAAVHALAYPLGGTFNVPHGVANSLLLPYVMEFNRPSSQKKFARIASALGVDTAALDDDAAGRAAIEAVAALCQETGIPTRLRDLDIPEDAVGDMAVAAMKVTRLLKNNPREVTEADAARIYHNAY